MDQSKYMSLPQVAALLHITEKTLRNRISEGHNHPPVVMLRRGQYLFMVDEFERWLRKNIKRERVSA